MSFHLAEHQFRENIDLSGGDVALSATDPSTDQDLGPFRS